MYRYPAETICAPATVPGGAISVIRVSGPQAIAATEKIFRTVGRLSLTDRKTGTLAFGTIIDEDGAVLDEVLVSLFRAPHSYTGEDSTEISCHGSRYIAERILELLCREGCRMAEAGEFTKRAFLNGKMDLCQAEAVADLIAAESAASHRMAINQMRGGFTRELELLREKLLHLTALLELELDFSDHEDLEFANRTELSVLTAEAEQRIAELTASFHLGNAIKEGIPVAIIGETNAGKSTLLNALLNEERAIVSDIHGTTRDVIEDIVNIGGTLFRFIDTAGLRETDDAIERLGIDRTFKKIEQAEIVLLLVDVTSSPNHTEAFLRNILPRCSGKRLITVYNKSDLCPNFTPIPSSGSAVLISAKDKQGLDRLRDLLTTTIPQQNAQNNVIVANRRHHEALNQALDAIKRVNQGLVFNLPVDLVSQDLRECICHLAEITHGGISPENILHKIFSTFCIGK